MGGEGVCAGMHACLALQLHASHAMVCSHMSMHSSQQAALLGMRGNLHTSVRQPASPLALVKRLVKP